MRFSRAHEYIARINQNCRCYRVHARPIERHIDSRHPDGFRFHVWSTAAVKRAHFFFRRTPVFRSTFPSVHLRHKQLIFSSHLAIEIFTFRTENSCIRKLFLGEILTEHRNLCWYISFGLGKTWVSHYTEIFRLFTKRSLSTLVTHETCNIFPLTGVTLIQNSFMWTDRK